MRSDYFFPTPNLAVRPAQFMGEQIAKSKASKYGMNVGPMVVTWIMRFVYTRVETYTGQALSHAYQKQRRAARQWESPEDRAARKAAKKAAKKAAREESLRQEQEAEQAELLRRQQAATAAHENLFGPAFTRASTSADISNHDHHREQKQSPEQEEDDRIDESLQKEFQDQINNLDMDDLD